MESRIEILNRLAKKYSDKEGFWQVETFEEWLLHYDPQATIILVRLAMQEYCQQNKK